MKNNWMRFVSLFMAIALVIVSGVVVTNKGFKAEEPQSEQEITTETEVVTDELVCEKEEHVHTDDCFELETITEVKYFDDYDAETNPDAWELVETTTRGDLICEKEEHQHSSGQGCYLVKHEIVGQEETEETLEEKKETYDFTVEFVEISFEKGIGYDNALPIDSGNWNITTKIYSDGAFEAGEIVTPVIPGYYAYDSGFPNKDNSRWGGDVEREAFNPVNLNVYAGYEDADWEIPQQIRIKRYTDGEKGDSVNRDMTFRVYMLAISEVVPEYVESDVVERTIDVRGLYWDDDKEDWVQFSQQVGSLDEEGKIIGGAISTPKLDGYFLHDVTINRTKSKINGNDVELLKEEKNDEAITGEDTIYGIKGSEINGTYYVECEYIKLPEVVEDPETQVEKHQVQAVYYFRDFSNPFDENPPYVQFGTSSWLDIDPETGIINGAEYNAAEGTVKGGLTTDIISNYVITKVERNVINGNGVVETKDVTADSKGKTMVTFTKESTPLEGNVIYNVYYDYANEVEEEEPEEVEPQEEPTPENPTNPTNPAEPTAPEDLDTEVEAPIEVTEETVTTETVEVDAAPVEPVITPAPEVVPVADTTVVQVTTTPEGDITLTEIDDVETALANQNLDHLCNILYFLLLLATTIILYNYFRSSRKHQERIFELRSELGKDDPYRNNK